MGLRFKPVDAAFYDLFSEAAQHLVIGSGLLAEMLAAEGSAKQDVAKRMRAAEHDADETTHGIVRRVNTTFITPFDREDIYALASALDDVMDEMDEAVDLILLYEVETLPAALSQQVEVLARCAELTADAMPNLRSMQSLEEYWIEVNRLENTGDRNHRQILAHLFSGEYKTMEVLKLKDIVEALESAIDAFEKVANIVEQIAVKEG
ncbi:MAG: phosphate transport regulator [Pimelobacter sp.]|nr:phosphate transport regulator [Pimelobacter sp.]